MMFKKYIFFILGVSMAFWSCEDDPVGPTLKLGEAPSITAPSSGSSFLITEETAGDAFASFTWTAADFGYEAGVSYALEMDVAGNGFADATALGSTTTSLKSDISNQLVNDIMIASGLSGGVPSSMEVRVVATVSEFVDALISAPITLEITPFEQEINYPFLHVPGSYQGWAPDDSTTVIYSVELNNNYEGYIFLDAGAAYKFTDGPIWAVNWGDDGADGVLDPGGGDIFIAEEGLNKINVNLDDLTHSATKTDWGLVGDATAGGWDTDEDMTFDAVNNKLTITTDLTIGAIKFRANDDWPINLGDTGANLKLEYGGDDIAISEAGNYTIDLILNRAVYTYVITKN